jgi:DNA-binding response OmpR family regulator
VAHHHPVVPSDASSAIRAGLGLEQVPVLLVEDDARLRSVVARALGEAGARVHPAGTGQEALAAAGPGPVCPFAVVVLDIGLPDSDGRDVCQALRSRGITTPVLFLTARGQVEDVVSGFGAGGDDYLAKPFRTPELLVRLGALAHRAGTATPSAPAPPGAPAAADAVLAAGDRPALRLDPVGHPLVGAAEQPLTPTEYRVLAVLLNAPGEVVRRKALAAAGWSHGAIVSDNTLDQYVARLRRKVAAASGGAHQITTVHGVGHRFS